MSKTSTFDFAPFDALLRTDGPVMIAGQQLLKVAAISGDDIVFPPSYAHPSEEKNAPAVYNIDALDPSNPAKNVCVLDSIPSQANRIEPLFATADHRHLAPQYSVKILDDVEPVSIFGVGHRIADAVFRGTNLRAEIVNAFKAYGKGNAVPLAKIGPTSLVFGVWDSRGTGAKVPRLINSIIRAFDVVQLKRSAQYSPPIKYEQEGLIPDGLDGKPADHGLADVPSSHKIGGVQVNGIIRRDFTLNLSVLRLIKGTNPDETMKLQRYILGLSLVAFTATQEPTLRQGCCLIPKSPPTWKQFSSTGQDPVWDATGIDFAGFARAAAEQFGVSQPVAPLVFDKKLLKASIEADSEKKAEKKAANKDDPLTKLRGLVSKVKITRNKLNVGKLKTHLESIPDADELKEVANQMIAVIDGSDAPDAQVQKLNELLPKDAAPINESADGGEQVTTYLRITVRFLDARYHGLLDRGGPQEWPPAPFRLFCAMVAGVARRGELDAEPGKALEWLQSLEPPIIIAPYAQPGQAIIRYVPNNDGDKKPDRQERLTGKSTMSTIMLTGQDESPCVHYLWNIEGQEVPWAAIRMAARSLTTLGWGIDMAFADVAEPEQSTEEAICNLPGERWYPKSGVWRSDGMLRVPVGRTDLRECTLCDLRHCHETVMRRIEHGKPLHTVDKPRVFDRVFYSNSARPQSLPNAVFRMIDENDETFSYPHAKLCHISGMVRHLALKVLKNDPPHGRDEAWVGRVIRGMPDKGAGEEHQQFSYLPLPSVGHVHVDAKIRNVMVVAPHGMDLELEHLAERLDGQALEPEHHDEPLETGARPEIAGRIELQRFTPTDHFIKRCYLAKSQDWYTVTPAILDGHHEHKSAKIIRMIQTALRRAGVETPAEFTWQAHPFLKHGEGAYKYDKQKRHMGYHRPEILKGRTALHLRIHFEEPVIGPLAVGAGRYRGFGLFAAEFD